MLRLVRFLSQLFWGRSNQVEPRRTNEGRLHKSDVGLGRIHEYAASPYAALAYIVTGRDEGGSTAKKLRIAAMGAGQGIDVPPLSHLHADPVDVIKQHGGFDAFCY